MVSSVKAPLSTVFNPQDQGVDDMKQCIGQLCPDRHRAQSAGIVPFEQQGARRARQRQHRRAEQGQPCVQAEMLARMLAQVMQHRQDPGRRSPPDHHSRLRHRIKVKPGKSRRIVGKAGIGKGGPGVKGRVPERRGKGLSCRQHARRQHGDGQCLDHHRHGKDHLSTDRTSPAAMPRASACTNICRPSRMRRLTTTMPSSAAADMMPKPPM